MKTKDLWGTVNQGGGMPDVWGMIGYLGDYCMKGVDVLWLKDGV